MRSEKRDLIFAAFISAMTAAVDRACRSRRFALLAGALCFGTIATANAVGPATDAPYPLAADNEHRAICVYATLRELGWRFAPGDGERMTLMAGLPCERADLADAQRAGDLRAVLPSIANLRAHPSRWIADLEALLANPATVCAYDFKLGAATHAAADKLSANRDFRMSAIQAGWIGFGMGGAANQGWRSTSSWGRAFQPSGSNSRAIATFYNAPVRAECGVGRQIAQLATQRELYGPHAFDAQFSANELSIGTFNKLHHTDSILLGAHAGDFIADGLALAASREGRQAFVGLPGFIEHAFESSTLSDTSNQAENFVVYDVTSTAADALRVHAGFAYYNARNHEVWQLAQAITPHASRWFERLLFEHDAMLRAGLSPTERDTVARIDAILDDPFYRGFLIYVHPHAVKPVAFHIARLLDRNPRTPYRIELTLHNLHTTLYRRYVEWRIADCMGADDSL